MQPVLLHDKPTIEAFLQRDPQLNLYALGDLDDFFWPYTSWMADVDSGEVKNLLLLYSGGGLPVLLALAAEPRARLAELVQGSLALLPRRFYAHFSPGIADTLRAGGYQLEPHGRYLKMGLTQPERLRGFDTGEVAQFTPGDVAELTTFYTQAYPGNWFDPRMLETGCYYGLRRDGQIVSVAGIHVYSPRYSAAALGNITTLPAYRGQGFGKMVTARLCQALSGRIEHIGLNVRADNQPALRVYTQLGFTPWVDYEEYMVQTGPSAH